MAKEKVIAGKSGYTKTFNYILPAESWLMFLQG